MITNGIWFIDAVEINGGSTNFMNGFLPLCVPGHGNFCGVVWRAYSVTLIFLGG